MKNLIKILILISLISTNVWCSIAPNPAAASQMVNLKIQLKGRNNSHSVKTDFTMPFYQTAEIEKTIDNKDYFIRLNPKLGKDSSEIEIEVKLLNKDGSKVLAKKDIVAKFNKENVVSIKGVTFRVTPAI